MRRVGIVTAVGLVSLAACASASGFGFVRSWGTEGTGSGQFESPSAVAVDTAGNVYVADTANNRIQKFDSQGNFLLTWGTAGSGQGQFNGPQGITVDPAGNVYVADTFNHRFQKFSSTGMFLLEWGSFGTAAPNGFRFPSGIGSAGNLVLTADTGNARVFRFNNAGVRDLTFGTGNDVSGPTDAAGGQTGIFIADPSTDSIRVYTDASAFVGSFGRAGGAADRLNGPSSVDVVPSGGAPDTVWIADTENNRVSSWTAQGATATAQSVFGTAGTCPGQFRAPAGIAVTAAGEVYVADTGNNRIVELGPSGDANAGCPVEPEPEPPALPDSDPPDGSVSAPAKVKTRKKHVRVQVTFGADEASTFACRLDGGPLTACVSPLTLTLKSGKHLIEVIATDTTGNADPDPPVVRVKVVRRRK
jgi:DNA-binding beta-propeller fold protein YncE